MSEIIFSSLGVPYVGAYRDVDLDHHTLNAATLVVNNGSGGWPSSITITPKQGEYAPNAAFSCYDDNALQVVCYSADSSSYAKFILYPTGTPSGSVAFTVFPVDGMSVTPLSLGGTLATFQVPIDAQANNITTTGTGTFNRVLAAKGTALLPGIAFSDFDTTGFYGISSTQLGVAFGGVLYHGWSTSGVRFTGWLDVGYYGDTYIQRSSAGVLEITNGTSGQYRDLLARDITATCTTEQLRLAYDATHYNSFTVDSAGTLTVAPNQTAQRLSFNPNCSLDRKTYDTARGAEFFSGCTAGQRPSLRYYGWRSYTGYGAAGQNWVDMYIDQYGYGKFTGGGAYFLGFSFDNPIALDAGISIPASGRYTLGTNSYQYHGGTGGYSLNWKLGNYSAGSYYQSAEMLITSQISNTYDYSTPYSTDPVLYIFSDEMTTTHYLMFKHNKTDGVIKCGSGTIDLQSSLKMGSTYVISDGTYTSIDPYNRTLNDTGGNTAFTWSTYTAPQFNGLTTAGFMKTDSSGVVSIDTTSYMNASQPHLPDYTGISTPAEGDIGYDYTNHYPVFYDGSNWVQI